MSPVFLGLDTSNYKTSAGLFCPETGAFRQCGKLLSVPRGSLVLRQSEALFQHIRQLADRVQEALDGEDSSIAAIGFSARPRDLEGSYMPCFLAGECAARCMGSALRVPVYDFSHQQGHLAAAAFSAGRLDLLTRPFLAWHLSGGTTELLLVEPSRERIIAESILGGTQDISAGQLIDRVGVALGTPFPAGPYVEQMALRSQSTERFSVRLSGGSFSLSGMENQFRRRLDEGQKPEDVCRFVLNTVAWTILRATRRVREQHPLPVLISGGVSVCSLVQEVFAGEADVSFAAQGLGGDNGVGAAILASMR